MVFINLIFLFFDTLWWIFLLVLISNYCILIIKTNTKLLLSQTQQRTQDVGTQPGKTHKLFFSSLNSNEMTQRRPFDKDQEIKISFDPPSQPPMNKSKFQISRQGRKSCQLRLWPLSSFFYNFWSPNSIMHLSPL